MHRRFRTAAMEGAIIIFCDTVLFSALLLQIAIVIRDTVWLRIYILKGTWGIDAS
jgi:hypothetical protein